MKYWEYPFVPKIQKKYQIDLGQGNTPLENAPDEIITKTSYPSLKLKREDLNPNGSFKDRALALQISLLQQQQTKYCVLSSTGNAAISLCAFAKKANLKPIILVSPNIAENKLSQIISHKPFLLIKSPLARRLANYIHKKFRIPIINPSKNKIADIGFETLGWEIHEQHPKCDSIFSFSTSGASLIGIFNYYFKKNLPTPSLIAVRNFAPKIHTSAISTDKSAFTKPLRNQEISSVLEKSHGSSHYIFVENIFDFQKIMEKNNYHISSESLSAITSAVSFSEAYPDKYHHPVCIISGREHPLLPIDPDYHIYNISTKKEIDQLLSKIIK